MANKQPRTLSLGSLLSHANRNLSTLPTAITKRLPQAMKMPSSAETIWFETQNVTGLHDLDGYLSLSLWYRHQH